MPDWSQLQITERLGFRSASDIGACNQMLPKEYLVDWRPGWSDVWSGMLLVSYCTQALAARKRKLSETNETMDLRSVESLSLVQICTLPLWSAGLRSVAAWFW